MDKDLAAALMLERCSCYDKALESAKKVLKKSSSDSENSFLARKIIKSLGEEFLKQRFMEKAMDCYQVLTDYDPEPNECPDTAKTETFTDLGPNNIEIKTMVSKDVFEIFKAIENNDCSGASNEEELLREAIFQLILKYASNETIRKILFNKLETIIRKDS
jgi:tetratricopeptide (TPR) repeat protein